MTDIDYARRLLLDPAFLAKEKLRVEALAHATVNHVVGGPSREGISVIVATYEGAERLPRLLDSLNQQTLDHSAFEIVVVDNGPDSGAMAVLEEYRAAHPDLELRAFHRDVPSAGGARNLGLRLARRQYVTFIDDDDWLQPRFLEVALAAAADNHVVLSPIVNTVDGVEIDSTTTLNTRILALQGATKPLASVPWALGFNACKLVPVALARRFAYRDDLRSGEDLVYFAHLLEVPGLMLVVPGDLEDAAYVRVMRDESVSRRALTRDFAVSQRLACIAALAEISLPSGSAEYSARKGLADAQAGFVCRYLEQHPDERASVAEEIAAHGLFDFPWSKVNADQARDLAFAYCFAPYSDTSGVVAAKALAERGQIVDVISNKMDGVRHKDPAVLALAAQYLGHQVVVDSQPSFAGWEPISQFATQGLAEAEKLGALKGGYETMYSRALWIGSHVAAALYKLRHHRTHWSAEFSDPLRRDASGSPRKGDLVENAVTERLRGGIAARGFGHLRVETVFDLTELAAFVLADEVIFTNQNQMDYMLSLYDDRALTDLVRNKATVRHHPVPPASAYRVVETSYVLPKGVVNIGYFGSFYENRGIGEVLTAMENLPVAARRRVRLHVFCNKVKELRELIAERRLQGNVYVNPYLSYMEFLNASSKFDVLLVNDVERGDGLLINPFLPSKYSDYLGSGAKVWAIVDEGSPLSRMDVPFKSDVGNLADIAKTLAGIVQAHQ